MSLIDFDKRLKEHDWYYGFSDDNRSYMSGKAKHNELKREARETQMHAFLYSSYCDFAFSGHAFSKEQEPSPKLAFWSINESPQMGFVTYNAEEYTIYSQDDEVKEITERQFMSLEGVLP